MDIEGTSQLTEIDETLAIFLFGSKIKNESLTRDIDICIVAPNIKNKTKI